MTSRIEIPFSAIEDLDPAVLDLGIPARCSRCNTHPALFIETHPLKYQAGFTRSRTMFHRFKVEMSIRLQLPICERCHQKDFTEAPDSMLHGSDMYAGMARRRSAGIISASLIACAAFILLMKIIPLPPVPSWLGSLWIYLAAVSVLVLLATNFFVSRENNKIKAQLQKNGYDLKLHRADVTAKMQYERQAAGDTAIVMQLENDSWAADCAEKFGWNCLMLENHPEKEK
jgi:membrane protein implicated in regulation of membrane protease activity